MIHLNNISKVYSGDTYNIQALKHISLDIKQGEFVSIMGRSGSGKTTLLNILGFLDNPDEGELQFIDKDVSKITGKEMWRYRRDYIGFVFQHFDLIDYSTVFDNIALPLDAIGTKKSKRNEIVNKVLEQLDITELKNKYPGQISGGQKQRVAIARALACEPKLILADEPTGALDSKTGDEIMKVFHEINQLGTTIIVVTHDINIANMTKRIITLEDSLLISDELVAE